MVRSAIVLALLVLLMTVGATVAQEPPLPEIPVVPPRCPRR